MPTEDQRESDRQFNERANQALAAFERSVSWSLSVAEKAMFLSGYVICAEQMEQDNAS